MRVNITSPGHCLITDFSVCSCTMVHRGSLGFPQWLEIRGYENAHGKVMEYGHQKLEKEKSWNSVISHRIFLNYPLNVS